MFNVGSVQGYLKLNTTGWNSSMRSATASVTALSRTVVRMGAVTLGSLFLIEREFGRFDKAIRHATSVSEVNAEQFKKMSEMALDASVRWNKAAAQTAQAFYFLGSAGLSVTEQMQAFNTTIMLSRAMGSELGQTVEGVVDIVRAFGLEFANIDQIADQLTKTVTSSNQQFRDLSQALSYGAASAKLANNTLAETTAMLGVMANAGIKGSMAGTVLRRAMTNLMSPTGAMSGLIYEMGLNIYDATGRMNPFINIMGQISDRLKGATDAYKNMVFEVLFGRRAISGQIVLFNYGSEALRRYANEIKNAGGATERVAGKQMKAFTEQLGKLWREMQRVAIMVGGTLAPAIERLGNTIRDHLVGFREYLKYNDMLVAEMLKWTVAVSAAAVIIPLFSFAVMGLANQFIQLGTSITRAGIAMATSPLFWKLSLLAGLLYTLRMTLGTDFWKQAWEKQIKPFLSIMGSGFTNTITRIMWEFSLIPDAVDVYFSRLREIARLTFHQITLYMRGHVIEAYAMNAEIARLHHPDVIFAPIFSSDEERDRSLGAFRNTIKIVGEELVWQGKAIGADFGAAFRNQFEKDLKAALDLITSLVPDRLKNALTIFKDAYDALMYKPDAGFAKMRKELDEFNTKLREYKQRMADASKVTTKQGEAVGYLRGEWNKALEAVFAPPAGESKTWFGEFTSVLESIQTQWTDAFDTLMQKGSSFGDFMDSLWQGVLSSFRRMLAKIMAEELLYQMSGGKIERTFGIPRISHLWEPPSTYYEPGLKAPSYGARASTGLGGLSKAAVGETIINITNTGTPASLRETGRRFNGKQWVIDAVMEEYSINPNFREGMNR